MRVAETPPPTPVLSFYGIGGAGKSTLLLYLRHALSQAGDTSPRPDAFITFQPGRTPPTAPEALWQIRSQLAKQTNKPFPRFDLLWGTWWERTYHASIKKNPSLISEEADLLADILSTAESVPMLGIAVKVVKILTHITLETRARVIEQRAAGWLREKLSLAPKTRNVKHALRVIDITRVHDLLPAALAADLADMTDAAKQPGARRMVIFVDTYERLEDSHTELNGRVRPTFVEDLARSLIEIRANVGLVVAGRNPLHWAERRNAHGEWDLDPASFWALETGTRTTTVLESRHLLQYCLDVFSPKDAQSYLVDKRGLAPALAESTLQSTGGLPLALAAVGDLLDESGEAAAAEIRSLRETVGDTQPLSAEWLKEFGRWLLARMLDQLQVHGKEALVGTLRAASIPRWFTEDLLYEMVDGGASFQEQFDQLTRYGFVEPRITDATTSVPAYSIHPVVRREMLRSVRITKQWLSWQRKALAYFEGTGGTPFTESDLDLENYLGILYHRTILDPGRGLEEAQRVFDHFLGVFQVTRAQAVIDLLRDLADQVLESRALAVILNGRLDMGVGAYRSAITRFTEAEALLAAEDGAADRQSQALVYHAEALRLNGDYKDALAAFRRVGDMAERLDRDDLRFVAAWGLSLTYKLQDEFEDSLASCEQAELIAPRVGRLEFIDAHTFGVPEVRADISNAGRHKSELLRQIGDYAGSRIAADSFLDLYRPYPDSLGYCYANLVEAQIQRMESTGPAALDCAINALVGFQRLHNHRGELTAVRQVGQILYQLSRLDEAAEQFTRLLANTSEAYPYGAIFAHLGLGELARLRGDADEAEGHYRSAMDLCEALHGRMETAYGCLGLAELARAAGDPVSALRYADQAHDIGMSAKQWWTVIHALLAKAACTTDDAQTWLDEARSVERKIRHGADDRSLELAAINQVAEALQDGVPVEPLRFNFP